MALQIGIGNFSGAIACNIYRTRDHPRYILGRESLKYLGTKINFKFNGFLDGLELMFIGIGFLTAPLVIILYKRINAQRDAVARSENESGDKMVYTDYELKVLGDKAPDFRYTL